MIKIIFLTLLTWSDPGSSKDSLRMETINGKQFIIHQVGDHETLYGISKRYGTPIASIIEYNPSADGGLSIGQILKVLYLPKSKNTSPEGIVHKVQPKETLFSISRQYNVSTDEIKSWNNLKDNSLSSGQELIIKKKSTTAAISPVTSNPDNHINDGKHVVEPKETLYAISKKYGITIQQIKDWNSIQGNEVKPGDVLLVTAPKTISTVTNPEVIKPVVADTKPVVESKPIVVEQKPVYTEPKPVNIETKPVGDTKTADPVVNPITISETVRGSDEIKEGGLAELIEGTDGNRKYLALHRSAKVGTIIKVRNELNNREVFVRVVGALPATGINDKIIIKISKSAFDRLGAIDPKFRAEVTYYK